jgi:hypothetical protein
MALGIAASALKVMMGIPTWKKGAKVSIEASHFLFLFQLLLF